MIVGFGRRSERNDMITTNCDLFHWYPRLPLGQLYIPQHLFSMSEKAELPSSIQGTALVPRVGLYRRLFPSRWIFVLIAIPILYLQAVVFFPSIFEYRCDESKHGHYHHYTSTDISSAKCPAQPPALYQGKTWDPLDDPTYAELVAKRLSKAVQINTESFDNLPLNASDPIFDKHYAFSHFLEAEYPKLFSDPIKHEFVNTHGHLFTWQGSNPELQPIVLMAHIDTVPVLPATRDLWTFPPFEGTISVNATEDTPGTWIWGRGSSDCKNSLLGIYGAVERLVPEGFKPERTILIANGFDEEVCRS